MATPSKPSLPLPKQRTLSSSPVAEEEADEVPADKFLPVLKWKCTDFRHLMTTIQMPESYGTIYPGGGGGDTTADAPAGMVTMFAEFFSTCNLQLPQCRFLWWTCWNIKRFIFPSLVRWGWYIHVQLGFYSFYLRNKAPKIMSVPPKGFIAWKTKFFYVKEVAVTCKQQFRNVTGDIAKEKISLPVVRKTRLGSSFASRPLDGTREQGVVVSADDAAKQAGCEEEACGERKRRR
ncbi:hypothetical protein Hanom_Chr06g00567331 [Helianthus anomalus]